MIQNLSSIFQSKPIMLELLCILVFGSIIFVWGVRYSNIKDEFKHFNLPKWLRDSGWHFQICFRDHAPK
jgi:hypothetical protein